LIRIVDDAVEPAERVPRVFGHGHRGVEIAEVDGPQARFGRVLLALREHGVEALTSASDDADGGAALGEHGSQRGADARRCSGDQDRGTRDLHGRRT
jgi:hypothetical protein